MALSATLLSDCSWAGVTIGPSVYGMCRNIRTLHNFEPPATEDEVRAARAAVRAQDQRLDEAVAGQRRGVRARRRRRRRSLAQLLDELVTPAPPKDREVEAAKARARARSATRRSGGASARSVLAPAPALVYARPTARPRGVRTRVERSQSWWSPH